MDRRPVRRRASRCHLRGPGCGQRPRAETNEGHELDLRRQVKECDAKLDRYRQLLEQDADITVAATWIAEVERERKRLERELGGKPARANSPRRRSRPSSASSRTSPQCWPTPTLRTSAPSTTSSA